MPTLRYLDPERVHHLSIQAAKYGLVPRMKLIEDPVLVSQSGNRENIWKRRLDRRTPLFGIVILKIQSV